MNIIRLLGLCVLIISATHLNGMKRDDKNSTKIVSTEILIQLKKHVPELVTKIFALCEPHTRNILQRVSQEYERLASPKNKDILLANPLILGKCDLKLYFFAGCRENNTQLIQNLLQNGANCNWLITANSPSLHYAVQKQHAQIVTLLLNHGAHINALDGHKCTPLHYAAGKESIVRRKLIFEPENKSLQENHNEQEEKRIEIVQLLLQQKDINIFKKDEYGKTALCYAKEKGFTTIVNLLEAF